jgi:Fe(II)/alpha-ketoglutarate-dependent arginine beta-hydroxylase
MSAVTIEEPTMDRFKLTDAEVDSVRDLMRDATARYDSVEDPEFLRESTAMAHELPRRLRLYLNRFRLAEPAGSGCIVGGYPIDQTRIGRTPEHWKTRPRPTPTLSEEMYLVLLGSLLGDPIGWATQQDGRVVHDIFPIKSHQDEQLGTGSEQALWWHTEDAFHPYRGDYLGMMCLRNPDGVATTFATVDLSALDPGLVDLLFEPHFTIRPDESHLKKNIGDTSRLDGELDGSYSLIERMNSEPEKISILFGDRRNPYIRIDPYFMDPIADPPGAQEALDALIAHIDGRLTDVVLDTGEVCLIDNFRAVHGRKPFHARYDGNDRWLKRINVTRDLRRSRSARRETSSRVIH